MAVYSNVVTLNGTTPVLLAQNTGRGDATVVYEVNTVPTSGHIYLGDSSVGTGSAFNVLPGTLFPLYPGDALYACEDAGQATHGVIAVLAFGV